MPKYFRSPNAQKEKYFKWDLDKLDVMDSFLIPLDTCQKSMIRIEHAINYYNKTRAPKQFSRRKTIDGYRIWRVK